MPSADCGRATRNSTARPRPSKLSYRVVRNSAIDALRRSKSHPTVPIEENGLSCGSIEEPENDSADEDTYRAVVSLSRRVLGERQFEVFRLHDIEGQTYEEIAVSLNLNVQNVRVILSRARKTIRDIYRKTTPTVYERPYRLANPARLTRALL